MLLTKEEKRQFEYDLFVELMNSKDLSNKYRMSEAHIRRYIKRIYGTNFNFIKRKRNGTTTK